MYNFINHFFKDKQKTIGKLIPTIFIASILFLICNIVKRFSVSEVFSIFSVVLGITIFLMIMTLIMLVYYDAKEVQEKRTEMLLEEHNKRYPK